jgi:hypothetical protein|eukprot:COSAG06_NODE_66864_length_253_cov_0.675325_1_plen_50_part_00
MQLLCDTNASFSKPAILYAAPFTRLLLRLRLRRRLLLLSGGTQVISFAE